MTDEERLTFLRKCEFHLQKVLEERSYYTDTIKKTRDDLIKSKLKASDRGSRICNSYNGTIHISFDFAQQVHLPANAQQPGPVYFLTLYKVGIFGIMSDTDTKQCNVLIPEACQVSKGSNDVISFLHHYLENYSYGETHLHFHADNFVGQNKNNALLAYFSWRIIIGFNRNIRYSFMPVGNTKLSCDWAFGLIKKSFKHCIINTLSDLQKMIKNSTPQSLVNYSVLAGNEGSDTFIPVYDWFSHFSAKKLKPLVGITKYSHFEFDKSKLGVVKYSESHGDVGMEHVLLKIRVPSRKLNN